MVVVVVVVVRVGGQLGGHAGYVKAFSKYQKPNKKISQNIQKKAPSHLRYWLLLPFPPTVCRKVCDMDHGPVYRIMDAGYGITDRFVVVGVLMYFGWVGGWVGGGGGGGGGEGRGSVGWSCQNKGILKISKTKRKDISKYQKGTLALALLAPTPFPSNGMQKGV